MADLGRRRFLTGAGLAAGLVGGCRPRKDPYAPDKRPVDIAYGTRAGTEKRILSTCGMCAAGCGIRVRVVDGRAVKVEGNPESPINAGGLCARGLAGLELQYHPDRIPGPLRRRGGRGENRWDAISWDDAIGELRGRFAKLRDEGRARGALLIDGEASGATHALWARFMAALGSPNHVTHGATGRDALVRTFRAMTGRAVLPSYDFESAGTLLLVGTGAIESSTQAIRLSSALAGSGRPRLMCLSPRLPKTAALVDEWFAVEPGRAGAFLLGLLHVLLRDQLVDESAIEKARGFAGLRALVMATYSPDQVARMVGVPAARLQTLARELVASRPSMVVVDEQTTDSAAVATALVLNAVLSSIGAEGGMLLDAEAPAGFTSAASIAAPAAVPLDGRGSDDASRILAVPEAILSGKPYPVELLLLHYSNPAFSKPDGKRWAEALAKLPFVVSFSPVVDESTLAADLLLPDRTCFERWDVVVPGGSASLVSLRQPVVAPLGNALQTGDVILRLAAALGGPVAEALPWKSYRKAALAWLAGWAGDADELLGQLESKGACKVGRKMEKTEKAVSADLVDVSPAIPESRVPATGDAAAFPFVLYPFRDRAYAEGGFRHLPWLVELPSAGDAWQAQVEISSDDARRLQIDDGDLVQVTSAVGRAVLRARIHPFIKPGSLGLRLGGWGGAVGDREGVPSRLLAGVADTSGCWIAHGTRAKVEKVG